MQKRRKLTPSERKQVYRKYGGHCAYCGVKITMKQMQVDHMMPLYLGPQYLGVEVDTMDNDMPACRSCNRYKGTMTLGEFRAAIERWPEVLKRDSVYCNAIRFGQVKPTPHPVVFYFERMRGTENGNQADPV